MTPDTYYDGTTYRRGAPIPVSSRYRCRDCLARMGWKPEHYGTGDEPICPREGCGSMDCGPATKAWVGEWDLDDPDPEEDFFFRMFWTRERLKTLPRHLVETGDAYLLLEMLGDEVGLDYFRRKLGASRLRDVYEHALRVVEQDCEHPDPPPNPVFSDPAVEELFG